MYTSDREFLEGVFTVFRVENMRSGEEIQTGVVHRTLVENEFNFDP